MVADGTQVLTFSLGGENYCVDIDYVAEIVDGDDLTSLPDTDDHVVGIMDLRGRTTSIVNPCRVLDTETVDADEVVTDGGEAQHRIIVLDSETTDTDTPTGWIVSDVEEVTNVSDEQLETEPVNDSDLFRGVLKRDDEFTLWLDPHELSA